MDMKTYFLRFLSVILTMSFASVSYAAPTVSPQTITPKAQAGSTKLPDFFDNKYAVEVYQNETTPSDGKHFSVTVREVTGPGQSEVIYESDNLIETKEPGKNTFSDDRIKIVQTDAAVSVQLDNGENLSLRERTPSSL